MSLTNPMGDLVVSDPQAMRALAHPVRLAALSYLQRHGPATATQLAHHVGASPSVTSWHLRHLASFGLVDDADPGEGGQDRRQRWWKARARGWSLEMGEDPESQAAGRALVNELFATAQAQVSQWLTDTEPDLEPQWRRLAGTSNTRVMLAPAELDELQQRMTALLAEYVHRDSSQAPADARMVRVLRQHLPDGPE
jgi:DNA-binding transcriptional ArsR family regulator